MLGAQVMSYELTAEMLNFGAFLGFMGVNLAVIWQYWFRRGASTRAKFSAGSRAAGAGLPVLRRDLAGPEPAGQDRGQHLAGGGILCAGGAHAQFRQPMVMTDPSAYE